MVKLLKIKRRDFFLGGSIPILVSRTVKTQKFKFQISAQPLTSINCMQH